MLYVQFHPMLRIYEAVLLKKQREIHLEFEAFILEDGVNPEA